MYDVFIDLNGEVYNWHVFDAQFTAPDLAAIANSFDNLEHDAMEGTTQRSSSQNMDDTGFFSVQVMDKALDVWGLQ